MKKLLIGLVAGLAVLMVAATLLVPMLLGGVAQSVGGLVQLLSMSCERENGIVKAVPVSSVSPSEAPPQSDISKGPLLANFQKADSFTAKDRAEQDRNFSLIKSIGQQRGISQRGIIIAVATAIQEQNGTSRIGTVEDHDSRNLYQQRPSIVDQNGVPYWGTAAQIDDTVYSINRFYAEMTKKVSKQGIEQLPMIEVAIMIQIPDRASYYRRWAWDALATEIVTSGVPALAAAPPEPQKLQPKSPSCTNLPKTNASVAVDAARYQVGNPYIWGGTSETNGFDGSGLVAWSYAKAAMKLPATAKEQYAVGEKVDKSALLPGDLVFWSDDPNAPQNVSRVAMWIGDGQVIVADAAEQFIRVSPMDWSGFAGATRPASKPKIVSASAVTKLPGANVRGDDYPYKGELTWDVVPQGSSDPRVHSPLGYLFRECVDFVSWRLNQQVGVTKPPFKYGGMGHAATWKAGLLSRGFVISDKPVAGAVLWLGPYQGDPAVMFANNEWGHVAYVAAVNADGTMEVEQYNVGSLEFPYGDHKYHKVTLPASFASKATFLVRGEAT